MPFIIKDPESFSVGPVSIGKNIYNDRGGVGGKGEEVSLSGICFIGLSIDVEDDSTGLIFVGSIRVSSFDGVSKVELFLSDFLSGALHEVISSND